MSESVRYFLESRVPELEDLFKKGLFSKEEIKEIVSKRTKFEHKIKRRGAILEDFLAYIQYETELEQTRKYRYEMLNIHAKHSVSDHSIVKYILSLYRRAVTKFRGNMPLWDKYILFARESKSDKAMPKILAYALQLHPESVDIWIKAANWELQHLNNPASARTLFLRSIRMNKESKTLWFEYFRMELEVANTLCEKNLEFSDEKDNEQGVVTVFDGAIPISVFKFALKECLLSTEEAYEYYSLSLQFENMKIVARFIESFVIENMTNRSIFFLLKARSEISSINFDDQDSVSSVAKCMGFLHDALCCEALSSKILSGVLEILQSIFEKSNEHPEIRSVIFDKIYRILESGEKSNMLTPEIYLLWINICQIYSKTSDLEGVITRALLLFPEDPQLLEKKVHFVSKNDVINVSSLTDSFSAMIKSSSKSCSSSLDFLFKKYMDIKTSSLLELALLACNNFVPSVYAIEYILKYSTVKDLINCFDHIKISPEFIVVLIKILLDNQIFTEDVKKFVSKFSIFSSKAFNTNESALALIRFSLNVGDIELCNRLYAKALSGLPTPYIDSFSNSFELLKESTNVLPF